MNNFNYTSARGTNDREENFNTDELIAMLIGTSAEAQREFRKQVLELAKYMRSQGITAGGRVVRGAPLFPHAA
ncbi:MAG: hypothetical protein ACSHX9_05380 [Luteolibacter sp.]